MRFDLSSATDAASHAIFDPGALLHAFEAPARGWDDDTVKAATDAGNLLELYTAADGFESFRVLVDEPPPDGMLEKYRRVAGPGLLRVPGGRIFSMGIEAVHPGKAIRTAEEFQPRKPGIASEARMPPGDYRVEVWCSEVDYVAEKRRQVESLPASEKFWFSVVERTVQWGCLLTVLTVLGVVFAMIWRRSLDARIHAIALGVIGSWWLAWYLLSISPPARRGWARMKLLEGETEERWPFIVLLLRRLQPGESAGLSGIRAELA